MTIYTNGISTVTLDYEKRTIHVDGPLPKDSTLKCLIEGVEVGGFKLILTK